MSELPLLLPAQQELLAAMIEAEGHMPPEKRQPFIAVSFHGDGEEQTDIEHPALGRRTVFSGDIRVLAHSNLILVDQPRRYTYLITLLPAAYLYYGLTRQSELPEVRAAVRGVLAGALDHAQRALRVLERTKAGFGELHVPVHVVLELEAKREEVARLEQRLHEFDTVQSPDPA